MLHLILADSELEIVPKKIASHPIIQKDAKAKKKSTSELILDSNHHHDAMRNLKDSNRRGRPDIVHNCMLLSLDSPLNKDGFLKFYVHTRNDRTINVNSETRIPRSYNRFVGLIEQLFAEKSVPPNKEPLLTLEEKTLNEKLDEIRPEKTITLSEKGQMNRKNKFFKNTTKEDDLVVIVGGFPHGDFRSNVQEISDSIVKLYRSPLTAVTAISRAIQLYEEFFMKYPIFS